MNKTALLLTIDDDEVYDKLIVPYKSNRELTNLVTKLLITYYYNEDMKAIVDNEGMFNTNSIADSYNEYFKDINAILAIQGSMQESMEETLKTGLNDIIDSAEAREDIDANVWGEPVPKVSARIKERVNTLQIEDTTQRAKIEEEDVPDRLTKIENTLEKVMQMLMNDKDLKSEDISAEIKESLSMNNYTTADKEEKEKQNDQEAFKLDTFSAEEQGVMSSELGEENYHTESVEANKAISADNSSENKATFDKDRLRKLVASSLN